MARHAPFYLRAVRLVLETRSAVLQRNQDESLISPDLRSTPYARAGVRRRARRGLSAVASVVSDGS